MIETNWKTFEPPREILDQCVQVLLPDRDAGIKDIRDWCWQNCESFVWHELVDTSDVSYDYDSVAAFYFYHESDATLFRLRWL
jgi:hypothetical protein